MISYIKGLLTHKSPTSVIIEAGGIGYDINISLNTFSQLESKEQIQLHTVLLVKEDSHTLFGFYDTDERKMFLHLISVSGIGPNTARVILSSMKPEEARNHILTENVAAFNLIKGIGPKTAKRLILDLKDKLTKDGFTASSASKPGQAPNGQVQKEAISALMALGFPRSIVQKAITRLAQKEELSDVETTIKKALKELAG